MLKEEDMKARMLIGLVLLFAAATVFGFQSAQDVFQQALSKERVEGNLKEAIVLYQKTIDLSKEEALSAKAQLQIGFCYEKLGLQEAEIAFKLVIEKYPGQTEAVRLAKERLANISVSAAAGAPVSASGLTLRKLDIPKGMISPDGNYIASDQDELDLFLYDISAGKKSTLRKRGEKSNSLFSGALWAPDSKRFAYVWRLQEISSLNIWDIAAGSTKMIYKNAEINIVSLAGWTPDQKAIFIYYRIKDQSRFLGRVSLADGALTEVLADNHIGSPPVLSPDGRYIALNYNIPSKGSEIRCLSADGQTTSVLLSPLYRDLVHLWSPDGRYVIFSSQRSGQNAFWRLEVKDGRAVGDPVFIANAGDINYVGITKPGSLYYSTYSMVEDAFTSKIDLETGKTLQPPQKIEPQSVGRTTTPFFSADGKSLGYFFRKNVAGNPTFHDTFKIKDIDSESTREIPLEIPASPAFMQLPRWSRDGKFIHMFGAKSGQRGLIRLNVVTGQSELIANDQGILAWSSEGKVVYLIDRGTLPPKLLEQKAKLVRKDIDSGESRVLYQGAVGEIMFGVKLSPDESFLGFYSFPVEAEKDPKFKIIPAHSAAQDGKDNALSFPSSRGGLFNWDQDGKGLVKLIITSSDDPPSYRLAFYPKLDPKMTPVELELKTRSANIAFHPDGRTIAFTDRTVSEEFWVLENFLPKK
jgi:Tol biopolymer transport system component